MLTVSSLLVKLCPMVTYERARELVKELADLLCKEDLSSSPNSIGIGGSTNKETGEQEYIICLGFENEKAMSECEIKDSYKEMKVFSEVIGVIRAL